MRIKKAEVQTQQTTCRKANLKVSTIKLKVSGSQVGRLQNLVFSPFTNYFKTL